MDSSSKTSRSRGWWYCVGGKLPNTGGKSKPSSSWQQHRLTSHSLSQQPEGARAAGTKVWCKRASPRRHLGNTTQGKTTQGGATAATDGCQGMRQHQASTQEHFPKVLCRNTSPKCSPNLRLFLSQWISQAKHCFCHSAAFSETLPITHPVSS